MLYLGKTLLSTPDLQAIRKLVTDCHNHHRRPLVGLEMGPWLGRSTLAHLAPDLPIGNLNPLDYLSSVLTTADLSNLEVIQAYVDEVFRIFAVHDLEQAKGALLEVFSYLVDNKPMVYEQIYCLDTWGGIPTERDQFFKELDKSDPREIFLENMRKSGFEHRVAALQGDSWETASQLEGTMDTVFLDADHEYEAVVRDLFATRHLLRPDTMLYGHDLLNKERWPGVEIAVDLFVKHYRLDANIWIAEPEGIAHLQSLPPYEIFKQDVELLQAEHNKRYESSEYRDQFGLKLTA